MHTTPALGERLRLADLLAALSVATDLGHGRPPDDAMRTCLLATRLAERMGLSAAERAAVYYTALLRYVGCTAHAHEEAALFGGDEIAARAAAVERNLRDPRDLAAYFLIDLGHGRSPLGRARWAAGALPRVARAMPALAASNCEVGAAMARRFGLDPAVQDALLQLYERWDGRGAPHGLRGEALVLPMRVSQVASLAIAVAHSAGVERAVAVVSRRGGADLDPAVVAVVAREGAALLREIADGDPWAATVAAEPAPHRLIGDARLDEVASACADMVDLKLPFTRGHSRGVAELAAEAARLMGLPAAEVTCLRRAALFHDLGRVGVPNGIWERPGPLTASDWERVRLHPYQTERILARSPALAPLARLAGMHHERQDGSGYHRQASGAQIPPSARILAAADSYQAMTQVRPHRAALSPDAAAERLGGEAVAGRLDLDAVRAVLGAAGHRPPRLRRSWPAGLSDREVEVLRLIAGGHSHREVAQQLVIAPRTAAHHIQHIYDKIGVSTRAAATMFAMEHDLVPG